MNEEIEWVITVDQDDVDPEDLEKLEELLDTGEIEDHSSSKELLEDIRGSAPGTTLCSGPEIVGVVAGAITIYSFSKDKYSQVREYLDENDIEYNELTNEIIDSSDPSK